MYDNSLNTRTHKLAMLEYLIINIYNRRHTHTYEEVIEQVLIRQTVNTTNYIPRMESTHVLNKHYQVLLQVHGKCTMHVELHVGTQLHHVQL